MTTGELLAWDDDGAVVRFPKELLSSVSSVSSVVITPGDNLERHPDAAIIA